MIDPDTREWTDDYEDLVAADLDVTWAEYFDLHPLPRWAGIAAVALPVWSALWVWLR